MTAVESRTPRTLDDLTGLHTVSGRAWSCEGPLSKKDSSLVVGWEPPPSIPLGGGRDVVSIASGVPILPMQSAQITMRCQRAMRPDRLMISSAGTPGGAADWIVNDIKIGNRSQFVQSGDIPGEAFAVVGAADNFVPLEPVDAQTDFVLTVTYVGANAEGAPFLGALTGTVVLDKRTLMYLVLDDQLYRIEIVMRQGGAATDHAVIDLGPCDRPPKKLRVPKRVVELRRVPVEGRLGLYGIDEQTGLVVLELGIVEDGEFGLRWVPSGWQPSWLKAT